MRTTKTAYPIERRLSAITTRICPSCGLKKDCGGAVNTDTCKANAYINNLIQIYKEKQNAGQGVLRNPK